MHHDSTDEQFPDPRSGFKRVHKHNEDCFSARPDDDIVFIVAGKELFNLDKIGRKGGSTMWFSFRCNDPSCRALMLVRWDVLATFVSTAGRLP